MKNNFNNKNKSFSVWNIFSGLFFAFLLITEIIFVTKIFILKILPMKYTALIIIGIFFITALVVILMIYRSKKAEDKKRYVIRIIAYILSVIMSLVFIMGSLALGKLNETFDKITTTPKVKSIVGIYVLKDDSAKTIKDAANYKFGYSDSYSAENNKTVISKIEKDIGKSINVRNIDAVFTMVDALYSKDIDAIILSQTYVDILQEADGYADFIEKTRLLCEYEVEDMNTLPSLPQEATNEKSIYEPFVMYLSGSDTRSKVIRSKSRSDVNILAAINPKTKQILLINTPRDYFVPNPAGNGALDKLTHCGIYGIPCSVQALSQLYNQPISYYAQINFTGFETLVDAVGGVTVYSDVSVTREYPKYVIKKGYNDLNGQQALAFARERYLYANGDGARGEHQMQIITAIIDKMSSGAIVTNYSQILDSLQGMFVTDMPKDLMSEYIKMQIDSMSKWSVLSYSVTGKGGRNTTYSMPGYSSAYVVYPDEELVAKASDLIGKVLNGETLTKQDVEK